jgi:hypothetical protein
MSERFNQWRLVHWVFLFSIVSIGISHSDAAVWGQGATDSWEQIAADAIAAAELPHDQKSALILRAIRQAQLEARRETSPSVLGQHPSTPQGIAIHENGIAQLTPSVTPSVTPPQVKVLSPREPLRLSKRAPAQLPHFQFGVESEWQQPSVPNAPAPGSSHAILSPDWSWSTVLSPRPVWNMLQPRFPEQEQRLSTRPETTTPAAGPMNLHR